MSEILSESSDLSQGTNSTLDPEYIPSEGCIYFI